MQVFDSLLKIIKTTSVRGNILVKRLLLDYVQSKRRASTATVIIVFLGDFCPIGERCNEVKPM